MMKQIYELKGHDHEITSIDLHPEFGNMIVSADQGGKVMVWNLPFIYPVSVMEHLNETILNNRQKKEKNNNFGSWGANDFGQSKNASQMVYNVHDALFSPNGSEIASVGNDRIINLWM